MNLAIAIEDRNWQRLPALERLAEDAIAAASKAACRHEQGEISLLFTGDSEIANINGKWLGKKAPTNVLSFPAAGIGNCDDASKPLGDIVLAFGTVSSEAQSQGKSLKDHTTHLIVHGFLHLLGYDHMTEDEANDMERLEAGILKELGIPDPYE